MLMMITAWHFSRYFDIADARYIAISGHTIAAMILDDYTADDCRFRIRRRKKRRRLVFCLPLARRKCLCHVSFKIWHAEPRCRAVDAASIRLLRKPTSDDAFLASTFHARR